MKYFLIVSLTVLFGWISLACDCVMTPISDHIKDTHFILTGQVIELLDKEEDGHYFQSFDTTRSYTSKIKVLNSYKGKLKEGQIIELGSDFSKCSICFKKGGKYLLFLSKNTTSGKYFQKACSYSEVIENSSNYIEAIEKQTDYRKQDNSR